jgi:hypothetical protein
MKYKYIKLPCTKDEINHVERLYHDVSHPGCIGSIDCVHVGYAGAGDDKGKPSVVFEVTSSHTTKSMHVSRMFWGATTDITIVKFDEAVWEFMTGIYSTSQIKM